MAIILECYHCGAIVELPDELGGGRVPCPECGTPNRVPEARVYRLFAEVVPVLRDGDSPERLAAVERLADLDDDNAIPLLETVLADPDPAVFAATLQQFVARGAEERLASVLQVGEEVPVERLREALRELSPEVSAAVLAAVFSAGTLREQVAMTLLPDLQRTPHPALIPALQAMRKTHPALTMMIDRVLKRCEQQQEAISASPVGRGCLGMLIFAGSVLLMGWKSVFC